MFSKMMTLTAIVSFLCLLVLPTVGAFGETFSGKIIFVDPKIRAFILKNKNEDRVFHPTDNSKFMIDGERVLFGQLQRGDEVTVTLKTTNRKSFHESEESR